MEAEEIVKSVEDSLKNKDCQYVELSGIKNEKDLILKKIFKEKGIDFKYTDENNGYPRIRINNNLNKN
jgi:hypothetical protein